MLIEGLGEARRGQGIDAGESQGDMRGEASLDAQKTAVRGGRRAGALALTILLALMFAALPQAVARADGAAETDTSIKPEVGEIADEDANEIEGVSYDIAFVGLEESELESLLGQVSQLAALKDRPPPSLAALRRRAEEDLERFRQALRSEGFYASTLSYRIERQAGEDDAGDDSTPDSEAESAPSNTDSSEEPDGESGKATRGAVLVELEVEPGTLILLEDYRIEYSGSPAPGPDLPQTPEDLGLELGMAARAPEIVAAEGRLTTALRRGGYPLPRILDRKAIVDHALGAMTVTLSVDAGPAAGFGPVSFAGLQSVEEDTLQDLIPWTEGEPWNQLKVEELRLLMARTELFDSIVFELAEALNDDGNLPMTVRVVEADHRSFGGGVSFSTDIGPGAELFWEHRNLFSRNEQLRLSAGASLVEQSAKADFRKPRFLSPGQALLANLAIVTADTEAFEEQSITAYTGLERSIATLWTVSGGLEAELSELEDEEGLRTFAIYGVPLGLLRDSSDDPLNPTEGTKLGLTVTPSVGTIDENIFFVTSDLSGSGYLSVTEDDSIILAARGRVGSIVGTQRDILPATRRLYAGGGGSVRGFEFQSIGPEDDDGDPTGGRSVVEVGAEIRFRIFEDFGVVPFVEGGIIEDSPLPKFEEDFLWAVGLGLRYFTPIGPLRLDVAVPVNGRDSDDSFQFYVSLGQAF